MADNRFFFLPGGGGLFVETMLHGFTIFIQDIYEYLCVLILYVLHIYKASNKTYVLHIYARCLINLCTSQIYKVSHKAMYFTFIQGVP